MKNKPGWRISRTGSGSGPSLGFRTISVPLHVREAPPQKGDPGIWALPIKRGAQGLPGWFGAVYALLKTVMYILTHHAKPILKKRRDGLVILSVACTGSITNLVKPRPQPTGCIEGIRGVGQSLCQDLSVFQDWTPFCGQLRDSGSRETFSSTTLVLIFWILWVH